MGVAAAKRYDNVLSSISVKYDNPGYFATNIFKPFPVDAESDVFYEYDKEAFRLSNDQRQDRSEAGEIEHGWILRSYRTEEYALREAVTWRERENVEGMDLDADATETVTDALLLKLDYRLYALMSQAANNQGATNVDWTNKATADVRADVNTAKEAIKTATGLWPNTMVIPATFATQIMEIEQVKDEMKHVINVASIPVVPEVLYGLKVVVAGTLNLTGKPGSTNTLTQVWSDHIWIGYINPRPGRKRLTYGALFERKPGRRVRKYMDEGKKLDWVECEWNYDPRLIAKDCGYLLQSPFTA